MSNVAKTLRKAVDLINAKGLSNGKFKDSQGQIDAFEAIWQAATGMSQAEWQRNGAVRGPDGVTLAEYNRFWYASLTVQRWLEDQGLPRIIPRWSDNSTQQQVIAGLLECAEKDEK